MQIDGNELLISIFVSDKRDEFRLFFFLHLASFFYYALRLISGVSFSMEEREKKQAGEKNGTGKENNVLTKIQRR